MLFKKIIIAAAAAVLVTGISASAADLLAFPGAEGGGKYTTGARGKSTRSVYHVTNLNASGSGSFKDAVSKEGRIIVFDVGGTIELDGTLTINKSYLTILGQTAPGDGITFSGGDLLIGNGVKNIIMRHLRVRPTDKNGGEPDGLGGRWNKNIIIDHCSVSWSVDETLTLYAGSSESTTPGSYLTVQNCISSESMRMSGHFKGAHGYGGIIGATSSSWLNNLFAHHDSRSPRLDRELQKTDFSNNVIYNWGITNSAYGAEPYSYNNKTQNKSIVNWVNNYYKYGPGTSTKIRDRIFDVSNPEKVSPYSSFYFNGNYVADSAGVTENNKLGINNSAYADFLSEPVDMGKYSYSPREAEDAYEYVLANAGATLPKRDAVDARVINDVRNRTGRIINEASEVGGFIEGETAERVFAIPSDWKEANGMGSAKETDIVPSGEFAGYTWIEAYVNDWTEKAELPSNPMVTVLSPSTASIYDEINGYSVKHGAWEVVKDNETVLYHAIADAVGETTVTKMELYDSNTLIGSYNGGEINDEISLKEGTHYLTCRAYNDKGEKTQSTTSIVYVDSAKEPEGFYYTSIGSTAYDGKGGASVNDSGVYTVSGAGSVFSPVISSKDSCGFMYKPIKGDFDISVKTEEIPKFENYEVSGLMVRAELNQSAQMAMLAGGWLKYGENVRAITRETTGGKLKETYFKNSSGSILSNTSSYNTQEEAYRVPKYLRMKRTGDAITMFVSDSGTDWTDNPRQPMEITLNDLPETVYVGIAVDSAQGVTVREEFARASFGELILEGEETELPVQPTPTTEPTDEPTPSLPPEFEAYKENDKIYVRTDIGGTLYIAGYSADGRLESVQLYEIGEGESKELSMPLSETVTVMLWDKQEPCKERIDL